MANIIWAARALADVQRIGDYIDEYDGAAAKRVVAAIQASVLRLVDHPRSGPQVDAASRRKLTVARYPYVVIYRLDGITVRVLQVLHASENWRPR